MRNHFVESSALPRFGLPVPHEMATECRCSWILVTQLRGESHCSLRYGHGGEHRFAVDR